MINSTAQPVLTVHEEALDAITSAMARGSKLHWHPDPHSYVIEVPDGRMWLYRHIDHDFLPVVEAMREILYATGSRPPAALIDGTAL